jgi:hypothetical protein
MALGFISDETQVNGTTTGNQRAPATTVLPNGGYVTVWASDTGDGSGKAIMGQLFSKDGSKVGAEFLINTTTEGDQDLPDVVGTTWGSSNNVFFVVWQSAEPGGSVIRARRFREDGTPLPFSRFDPADSPTTDVIVSGTFGGTKPSAGLYGAERVAFVWEAPSGDGDGTAIVIARYAYNGSIPATVLNTTTAGDQVDPRVSTGPSLSLNVVWESREPTGDVIRGKIVLPAGTNSEVVVGGLNGGEDESLPNVSEGGQLAIWNSGTSIKAATLYTTGGPDPAITLNTTPGGVIGRSDVIRLSDGSFLAVYFTQSGDDGSSYSLRAERLSSTGESMSSEFLVPEKFAGTQEAPTIVQLPNGNIVVTWASEADQLGNFEIKQRILNLNVIEGDSGSNNLAGTAQNDTFLLFQGGDDNVNGGIGNDEIYYGAAFTAADVNDGGAGTDVVILQGDYDVTMAAGSLTNVEYLSLQSASSTRYQNLPVDSHDYDITFIDANVAAGQRFIVNASQLLAHESFTFDGAAESNGEFLIYGGFGPDVLIGGSGNDIFHFEGSRWGTGDIVNGGAGADSVVIRAGSGTHHIQFSENQLTGIESISVSDRFGLGQASLPSYEMVLANGNVTPGGTLIVNGSTLLDTRLKIDVDGSAVLDGNLKLYGGHGGDTFIGGAGDDLLYPAFGADRMTGGEGADTFQFRKVSDALVAAPDRILDFESGVDKIDLGFIDAEPMAPGNQAFRFVGGAFSGNGTAGSGSAGELRFYQDGDSGTWYVEGDITGDGNADFQILVTMAGPAQLVASDFIF